MSSWSGLDFFIFLIFLVNTLLGMARGGMKEIISMICLSAALVITIKFTIPLMKFALASPLVVDLITSQFFQNFMKSVAMPPLTDQLVAAIAYSIALLVCFVGTFSVCEGVLAYANTMEAFNMSTTIINRKAGAAFGATRGFVLVLIFIIILEHLFAGNVPASRFVDLLGGSAKKMDDIVISGAPQRYLEILQDKNLYNQNNILNDLNNPK